MNELSSNFAAASAAQKLGDSLDFELEDRISNDDTHCAML